MSPTWHDIHPTRFHFSSLKAQRVKVFEILLFRLASKRIKWILHVSKEFIRKHSYNNPTIRIPNPNENDSYLSNESHLHMNIRVQVTLMIRYPFHQILRFKQFGWAKIATTNKLILIIFHFFFLYSFFLLAFLLLKGYLVVNETLAEFLWLCRGFTNE